GARADFVFSPDSSIRSDLVAHVHVHSAFIGPDADPIRVTVRLQGEPVARWSFVSHYTDAICALLLPLRLLRSAPHVRLSFEVENPQSPAEGPLREGRDVIGDDLIRALGIKVQSIAFAGTDLVRYSWGDTVSFLPEGTGLQYMDH